MDFTLAAEFIELDNLLKALNVVPSGGAARVFIQEGNVLVNGEAETRVRRKLRQGDVVRFDSQEIRIVKQRGDE